MRKFFSILVLALIVISVMQCKKDDPIIPEGFDYGYYPVDTGMWWLYDIEAMEIDIDDNGDTVLYYELNYQIKEIIESSFIDDEGRETFRIERYKRDDENTDFEIEDVWYSNRINISAEKVEENVRYVKLRFPVKIDKEWNGNVYNTQDEEIYTISAIDESETIGIIAYDSVLTVNKLDEENLIERKYKAEKYAYGIGLVYMIDMDISSQLIDPTISVEERMEQGTIYRQQLVDYGIE